MFLGSTVLKMIVHDSIYFIDNVLHIMYILECDASLKQVHYSLLVQPKKPVCGKIVKSNHDCTTNFILGNTYLNAVGAVCRRKTWSVNCTHNSDESIVL